MKNKSIQIVSKHKIATSGTTQLRCQQPAEYLRSLGYQVKVGTIYREVPIKNSVIILHRVLLDKYSADFISYAKKRGNLLFYDLDDLIFTKDAAHYLERIGKFPYSSHYKSYRYAIQACDAVIVATPFLATQARRFQSNVHIVRNALSSEYIDHSHTVFKERNRKKGNYITIGYLSGSNSHDEDFNLITPAVIQILKEYENLKLLLVGKLTFSEKFDTFGERFEYRDFIPYHRFPDIFRKVDINLVPLDTTEDFCHAKSELKYIEAGVCGVPSIVSPTHTLQEVIIDNSNGLLAENDQWFQKIRSLIISEEKRLQIGISSRNHVLKTYTPQTRRKDWENLINQTKKELKLSSGEKKNFLTNFLRFRLESARLKRAGKRIYNQLFSSR